MSEIGVSGHVEDLVACPNFHSQIISNGLFRRLLVDCFCTLLHLLYVDFILFSVQAKKKSLLVH